MVRLRSAPWNISPPSSHSVTQPPATGVAPHLQSCRPDPFPTACDCTRRVWDGEPMVGGEFSIGKIAGVDIRLHWSLLVVFGLVTWSLATQSLPVLDSTSGTAAYWIAATAGALLFFAGLLAHEMGHALVARRKGVAVESITLWVFGGIASLQGETNDPADEFRTAAAGPLVSLGIGGLFQLIAQGLTLIDAPTLMAAVAHWLAMTNTVLAVFNLLPAFPLDGGRVLRAWLWRRRQDRASATRTAARAGRGFGYALIGLGLLTFMLGDPVSGLWLVLLGWFLLSAARAEESHSLLLGALKNVRVRHVMTPQPVTISAQLSAAAFIDQAMTDRFTSFPVVDDSSRVLGLITLTRVKEVPADERATTILADITVPLSEVALVTPDDTATTLLERMNSSPDGRALVFDGNSLVGIVSPRDIQRMLDLLGTR